ncbi:MAG: type VI secretion system-associated protein TagF [Azoarcus sp.]|jgi:type VI secretion system protein ImpM|nr:type VI secretion system-associated protein TagF [Azoarcus sp.]
MIGFFSAPTHYMGWFGKLPSVGDFAGRGMPHLLQETAHAWMSSGMAALVRTWSVEWRDAYLVSPVWHFIVNAGTWDRHALIGCIAPSIDKVGRCSPLLALRSFDRSSVREVLPPENRWLYQLDAALRRIIGERTAVEDAHDLLTRLLDNEEGQDSAVLAGLGIDGIEPGVRKAWFSWPELPALFLERNDRSFWWAEPSPRLPPRQIIHCGAPDEHLFCLLMDGGMSNE